MATSHQGHDTAKPVSTGSVQHKSGQASSSGDLSGRTTPSQAEGNEKDIDQALRHQQQQPKSKN